MALGSAIARLSAAGGGNLSTRIACFAETPRLQPSPATGIGCYPTHHRGAGRAHPASRSAEWGNLVDKITEAQLEEFSTENGLSSLQQSIRFEHYVSYVTVQNLYGETFDTSDIVLGGDELGIDGIAIIVNGVLVSDIDSFNAVADTATSLDAAFIFIQADRSTSFETAKTGNIIFAVRDFFRTHPNCQEQSVLWN